MVILKQERLLHLLLIVQVCYNLVQSAPPPLGSNVPEIKTLVYELTPSGNQYKLRLSIPESEREEVVELKYPDTPEQELTVMGTISQVFFPEGYKIVTVYVADRNGYRAQYKFERLPPEQRPQYLGPNALKTSAG